MGTGVSMWMALILVEIGTLEEIWGCLLQKKSALISMRMALISGDVHSAPPGLAGACFAQDKVLRFGTLEEIWG